VELYLYFSYISTLNVLCTAEVKNEWSYTSTSSVCFPWRGHGQIYCFFFFAAVFTRNCFLTPLFSVAHIPVPCFTDRPVPEMCCLMIIRYHTPLPQYKLVSVSHEAVEFACAMRSNFSVDHGTQPGGSLWCCCWKTFYKPLSEIWRPFVPTHVSSKHIILFI